MKTRGHKLRICLILGNLMAVFSLINGGCSKIDYYTETEWTYYNGTKKNIEIISGSYPDKVENHLVLMAADSKTVPYELPVEKRKFTVTASMTPYSFEGAVIVYDGIRYHIPGLYDGITIENLPSICNALNYRCEKNGNRYLFSVVLDDPFFEAIQPYLLESE